MKQPYEVYQQFREYHRANPGVYDFLVEKAREAKEAGYTRFGFPYVFNMARWEFGVRQKNTEFELNNDIAPYYARYIMMREDDLFDFFEVRSSSADTEMGWLKYKAERIEAAKPKPVKRSHEELLLDEMDERVQRMNYDNY